MVYNTARMSWSMFCSTFAIASVLYVVAQHARVVSARLPQTDGRLVVSQINQLKKELMTEYNRHTNPGGLEDVVVTTMIKVKAVGDIDERLEKLTTVLELSTLWTDPSIQWNVSRDHGIDTLHMDRDEVWLPEFHVVNRHYHTTFNAEEHRMLPVNYRSSGDALFHQTITTETTCDLDMTSFPFDRHTCDVNFNCNKWDVTVKVILRVERFEANMYFAPDGSWDVVDINLIEINKPTIKLNLSITFARKPTFVLLILILPMTVLALISPLVFLLPNQSGERVGFAITVLLAISVFMTIVADNVPTKSEPFPLVLTMLFISYLLIVAVVVVVIINARVYRLPDTTPIPRPMVWLLKIARRLCCCFRRRNVRGKNVDVDEDGGGEERIALSEGELEKKAGKDKVWTWKDVSWAIDMFFMTLMFIVKITLIVVFTVKIKSRSNDSSQQPGDRYSTSFK